jgi:hypothetical protein
MSSRHAVRGYFFSAKNTDKNATANRDIVSHHSEGKNEDTPANTKNAIGPTLIER